MKRKSSFWCSKIGLSCPPPALQVRCEERLADLPESPHLFIKVQTVHLRVHPERRERRMPTRGPGGVVRGKIKLRR
jgi:hypothetical protein